MIDLLLLGLFNTLFIWGVQCLFLEGFLFEGAGKIIENTIGTTASKPLFLCPPCMSSFWGCVWYISFYGLAWFILPYCICLCGLNFIIKEYLYP